MPVRSSAQGFLNRNHLVPLLVMYALLSSAGATVLGLLIAVVLREFMPFTVVRLVATGVLFVAAGLGGGLVLSRRTPGEVKSSSECSEAPTDSFAAQHEYDSSTDARCGSRVTVPSVVQAAAK